ncbi:lpg2744 family Dot/Icm T4SS effector [Legionella pneumophila serogroup 1]
MSNLIELASRNAALDRTKLLSQVQKIEFLNGYDPRFVEGLISLEMIDDIDEYVASLMYVKMTDKYTQEEKGQLTDTILTINNDRLISCQYRFPQLYQKLMQDQFLSTFFSSSHLLPNIAPGTNNQSYVTVSTNNKMKMESAKLYGHYEYYQCVVALITQIDGSRYFYHLNPNRIFGDYMGSAPLKLSGSELKDVKDITFILHPRSMVDYRELQRLQERNIVFKTVMLPVGAKSVSLSYDTDKDVLTVNNLEAGQTVTYNNLLQTPQYNRYQYTPEQYFMTQLYRGQTWAEALGEALNKYIVTRQEGATWWDLKPLFFNRETTKNNMIAAARIKKEVQAGATSFDFTEVSRNGLLNQLLTTAVDYQLEYQRGLQNGMLSAEDLTTSAALR